MEKQVQEMLWSLQDKGYKDFHSKLIPNIAPETIIGIRMPQLRKLAKQLHKDAGFDKKGFMEKLPHEYYEENNLHGLLLEEEKDFELLLLELEQFLPYIDNWATCDLLALKIFRKHPQRVLVKIQEWMSSDKPYIKRFGMETLMRYYLDEYFRPEYLQWVAAIRSKEYYVNMMIAWFFATALAKQYEATLPIILERRLDVWCHNKTIQKAVESFRITEEQKTYLRSLRIK